MKSSNTVFASTTNGITNAGEARGKARFGEGKWEVRGVVGVLISYLARPVAPRNIPLPPPHETELPQSSAIQKGHRDLEGPCDFPAHARV